MILRHGSQGTSGCIVGYQPLLKTNGVRGSSKWPSAGTKGVFDPSSECSGKSHHRIPDRVAILDGRMLGLSDVTASFAPRVLAAYASYLAAMISFSSND